MNRTEHKKIVTLGGWRAHLPPFWPLELKRIISRGWNYDKQVRPNFFDIARDLQEAYTKYRHLESFDNVPSGYTLDQQYGTLLWSND
jgi:hypothetical protein